MYFTRFIKSSQFQRIKNSKIAADSFWAVFGNGFGYALLLLSGIIIARFLGKDVYGEYGMVKSTMLYIVGFATMGLGITSTKYIAEFIKKDNTQIKSLARDAMFITLIASSVIALLLAIFAHPLADYLDTPTLALPFQILGCLIIFKAITTTQNGILAGFSNFKIIARNNVICSIYMLAAAAPLTYFFGLKGALAALLSTQAMNCILNYIKLHALLSSLQNQVNVNRKKELFLFSFPIAIQESSYTICHWGGTILLVKMSSIGELGIFSAVSQWNAIITFIPGLLSNVILSHLSSSIDDQNRHNKTIKLMLCVNLACTLTPFILVYILSPWIATFYGTSFHGMIPVLRVYTFCTIFTCCSNIFTSELIVTHHNWLLMIIRILRDSSIFLFAMALLYRSKGVNGALCYAWANVIVSALYIFTLAGVYKFKIKKATDKDSGDYKEIVYEGYGPLGIAIVVETATDNNQRTVANVRSYFTKHGGSLGTHGSLSFLFDHKSVFHIKPADPSAVEEFELELMDFDAELDADPEAEEWVIYGAFDQFNNIQKYLEDKGIEIVSSEFERIPTDYKEVTPEQRENIEKLLERFEDDEDVQNVFHNMKDED